MSKLISQLAQALGIGPGDYLVINQGNPSVTRRCTVSQFAAATGTSTGAVGQSTDPKTSRYISQLPLASQVYLNDTIMVDQGTPPITRKATVSQVYFQSGTSGANTELDASNTSQKISTLPAATGCTPADWTLVNQIDAGGNPVTHKVSLSFLAHACIGGPNWTLLTSGLPPSSQSPYPVTWSPSGVGWTGTNWIAMGYQPGNTNDIYIMTSPDRINWTVTLNASTGGYPPSFGAFLGNFAVCGIGATYSFYTANGGATWQGTTPTPLDFTAGDPISAGNGVFCGMRGSYTSVCAFNTNTLAVTYTTLPVGVSAYGVVFDGINHIACGNALSAHSPDGVTWTAGTQAPGGFLTGAGNGAGIAIICDNGGNVSRTTNSGVTWTLVPGNPLGGGGAWNTFYAQGEFIVITLGGYVYTSPDGLTWTPSSGAKNLPFIAGTTRWYAAYGAQGQYLAFPAGPSVPSNYYAIGQC